MGEGNNGESCSPSQCMKGGPRDRSWAPYELPLSRGSVLGPECRDVLHTWSKSKPVYVLLLPGKHLYMPQVTGMRWRQSSFKSPGLCLQGVVVSRPLFHPYQQGIENCGSLLLSDPLKFRWAEVLVRKFSEGRRGRPRSIGARAHTHLKGHLSLVCPLGFWVPESVKTSRNKRRVRLLRPNDC